MYITKVISPVVFQIVETTPSDRASPGGWSPMLVLAGITCCLGGALPAGYNIGSLNNPAKVRVIKIIVNNFHRYKNKHF